MNHLSFKTSWKKDTSLTPPQSSTLNLTFPPPVIKPREQICLSIYRLACVKHSSGSVTESSSQVTYGRIRTTQPTETQWGARYVGFFTGCIPTNRVTPLTHYLSHIQARTHILWYDDRCWTLPEHCVSLNCNKQAHHFYWLYCNCIMNCVCVSVCALQDMKWGRKGFSPDKEISGKPTMGGSEN